MAPDNAIEKLGANPYFEIDGQTVNQSDLSKYNPTDIASLTTYYEKDATKRFGDKAKDGAVIIETRSFATNKFEAFFKTYSKEYEQMIRDTDRSEIQYILNDRILTESFEGDLSLLNNKLMKDLKVIGQPLLQDKYKVQDKKIGVIINAERPKGLYNSKEKF
ncbi:MAG TPA: hypothetical protein PLJ08_05300 [Cyclobacteriaceae bacterium]|nr:hypothetical protein [Cyclobacteriaceae bacterium]